VVKGKHQGQRTKCLQNDRDFKNGTTPDIVFEIQVIDMTKIGSKEVQAA
jgi:hypothetical protein